MTQLCSPTYSQEWETGSERWGDLSTQLLSCKTSWGSSKDQTIGEQNLSSQNISVWDKDYLGLKKQTNKQKNICSENQVEVTLVQDKGNLHLQGVSLTLSGRDELISRNSYRWRRQGLKSAYYPYSLLSSHCREFLRFPGSFPCIEEV